jgi:hypothetical protein
MPTILYEQGFRFSFFAADGTEPPHVHVSGSSGIGKWWLEPVSVARSRGFTRSEVGKIERIIRDNHGYLSARWREAFPPRP